MRHARTQMRTRRKPFLLYVPHEGNERAINIEGPQTLIFLTKNKPKGRERKAYAGTGKNDFCYAHRYRLGFFFFSRTLSTFCSIVFILVTFYPKKTCRLISQQHSCASTFWAETWALGQTQQEMRLHLPSFAGPKNQFAQSKCGHSSYCPPDSTFLEPRDRIKRRHLFIANLHGFSK